MREHSLLSLHDPSGLHWRHEQRTVHSQGHPPQNREFREKGCQHIPLKNQPYFLPGPVEGFLPSRYPQDLSSLLLKRVQIPELWLNFNPTLSFYTHPALQLVPEVQQYHFSILDFSKQHRLALLSSQMPLFAPNQCRPIFAVIKGSGKA